MVRILGNNLSSKKQIGVALTCIYGVGLSLAKKFLNSSCIDINKKVCELSEAEVLVLRNNLETSNLKFEGDLRRVVGLNIKRLIEINCLRGKRHVKGLPVRGQRTRTNAKTTRRRNFFVRKVK